MSGAGPTAERKPSLPFLPFPSLPPVVANPSTLLGADKAIAQYLPRIGFLFCSLARLPACRCTACPSISLLVVLITLLLITAITSCVKIRQRAQ